MPRKSWNDPLYKRDLRTAWEECPTPQVRMLLWEIDRMQQLLVEAERVLGQLRKQTWALDQLVTPLWVVLDQEPAVRWRRQSEAAMAAAQPKGLNPLAHYRYLENGVKTPVPPHRRPRRRRKGEMNDTPKGADASGVQGAGDGEP